MFAKYRVTCDGEVIGEFPDKIFAECFWNTFLMMAEQSKTDIREADLSFQARVEIPGGVMWVDDIPSMLFSLKENGRLGVVDVHKN